MILQKRDKRILNLLHEHGFLEMEHVQRFFPNYTETRRRIIELKQAGIVREEQSPVTSNEVVLRLNPCSPERLFNGHRVFLHPKKMLAPNTFLHNSKVISIRLVLESLWSGEWIAESRFKGRKDEIPDAIFKFSNGNEVYVELENSLKGRGRFLKRLKTFTAPALTLYVGTSHCPVHKLQKYMLEPGLPPCAAVDYEDLFKSPIPRPWSPKGPLRIFEVREF